MQGRTILSLFVVAAWLIILQWSSWLPHDPRTLNDGLTSSINLHMVAGALMLTAAIWVFRWTDVGFNRPVSQTTLRILILPSLYLVLFVALHFVSGWPPPATTVFLAANTLIVGFSEELAFRGILFRGLLSKVRLWPSVWLTTGIFGAVHVTNGFTTGDWLSAGFQAVTAAMAGLFFMAVLLRTGSILIPMVFHATWDFLLTSLAAGRGIGDPEVASVGLSTEAVILFPLLLDLPLFLYALFLLRKVAKPWQDMV